MESGFSEESKIEPVMDLVSSTPREEAEKIASFIHGAFNLNDNAYVADQMNK